MTNKSDISLGGKNFKIHLKPKIHQNWINSHKVFNPVLPGVAEIHQSCRVTKK